MRGGEPGGNVLLRNSLVQEERWRVEPGKTWLKEELKKNHPQRRRKHRWDRQVSLGGREM